MKDKDVSEISLTILRISSLLEHIIKGIGNFGTDQKIYGSEIFMIYTIKENEGISVTDLACKLEVTKGAVSQILKKLERKGFILKRQDASNQSRLNLSLTPKGEVAYINHNLKHRELEDGLRKILNKVSNENIDFLKTFLSAFENGMTQYKKDKI